MNIPPELRYTPTHEWIRLDGDLATIGITDFAQHELGDVVYLDLPSPGKRFERGAVFGAVESVKAASDLYAPVSGEVVEVNEPLAAAPEILNRDPYGEGWMVRLRTSRPEELSDLLDASAYAAAVNEG